jgi:hypothetical protein
MGTLKMLRTDAPQDKLIVNADAGNDRESRSRGRRIKGKVGIQWTFD